MVPLYKPLSRSLWRLTMSQAPTPPYVEICCVQGSPGLRHSLSSLCFVPESGKGSGESLHTGEPKQKLLKRLLFGGTYLVSPALSTTV